MKSKHLIVKKIHPLICMTGISVSQWYHLNESSQKSSFHSKGILLYTDVILLVKWAFRIFTCKYSHVNLIDWTIKTKSLCRQYIFDSPEIACKTFKHILETEFYFNNNFGTNAMMFNKQNFLCSACLSVYLHVMHAIMQLKIYHGM